LRAAKHLGGNDFCIYTPGMNPEEEERLALKSNLRRSFENDELLLHYQPKIDLQTGLVVGAEALARWRHPEIGLVYPAKFIPLAEETRLILDIGEWVLNRACADYRLWNETIDVPGRISANLSLLQLRQPDFLQRVENIFARNEVSPNKFEIEITETTLMADAEHTIKTLQSLHDLGVSLAIDDFGTGYSSLSALQDFPVETLKIDRSFVKDIAISSANASIVALVIDMSGSMNIGTVAEGVETLDQLRFLQSLRCQSAQGMLFGDPMPASDFQTLIREQQEGIFRYRKFFAGAAEKPSGS
jgi:EAL domain-containing protein (putative c-di-GMP-specific phosphodiesterase class I)